MAANRPIPGRWRLASAIAAVLLLAGCASAPEGARPRHWSIGPFFETGEDVTALRPIFARQRYDRLPTSTDGRSGAVLAGEDFDLLWPVATYHGRGVSPRTRDWWRFLIVWGDGASGSRSVEDSRWSFTVFPVAFGGSERDRGYWGIFPLWGEHPHILVMDDWNFVLWPVYHTYTVKGVRSRAVLWPFITWREAPREGFGLWPLFGWNHQRESDHRYVLWPIVTWASYMKDRDTTGEGYSWMVWPLMGRVNRERERQWLALPPFFSAVETKDAKRIRSPWPFIELEKGTLRDRISVWPIYEQVYAYSFSKTGESSRGEPQEVTRRYGWKLVEDSVLENETSKETRFSIFPFFTHEKRWVKGKDGSVRATGSYWRVWPFWSRAEERGYVRTRVLDLNPIRSIEAIDRNWAPFWTLWREDERPDGSKCHHILLDFLWWHSGGEAKTE